MIDRVTDKVNGKWVHSWGSNFFIEPDNTAVENEYQAEKTLDLCKKAEILTISEKDGTIAPGWAKSLGKKVALRPDWERMKVDIMASLVLRKAIDHAEFVEWLMETGDEDIQEGNWWHDNFWGVCFCDRCGESGRSERAKNALGKILMTVRTVIVTFDETEADYIEGSGRIAI